MTKIKVLQGDLTKMPVDVIVNAANKSLLGGGGVDGAIHRAGGSVILEACKIIRARQGGCRTGEAVITTAGNLPAQFVIHTVGPIWDARRPEKIKQLLANCYRNSLQLASDNQLINIAFPNISTGVYRFPKTSAADIAIQTVRTFLEGKTSLEEVIFVCFDQENYQLYLERLAADNA